MTVQWDLFWFALISFLNSCVHRRNLHPEVHRVEKSQRYFLDSTGNQKITSTQSVASEALVWKESWGLPNVTAKPAVSATITLDVLTNWHQWQCQCAAGILNGTCCSAPSYSSRFMGRKKQAEGHRRCDSACVCAVHIQKSQRKKTKKTASCA